MTVKEFFDNKNIPILRIGDKSYTFKCSAVRDKSTFILFDNLAKEYLIEDMEFSYDKSYLILTKKRFKIGYTNLIDKSLTIEFKSFKDDEVYSALEKAEQYLVEDLKANLSEYYFIEEVE